jgi:REP element-mobilizing transposase RayT
MVTYRLADALPLKRIQAIQAEAERLPVEKREAEIRRCQEAHMDRGDGACWLRVPAVAEAVESAFTFRDGEAYLLHAWVVMPNHVHVLLTPQGDATLAGILKSWKSFTSKEANRLLGRQGTFWQADYWDRSIRNQAHFDRARDYIENNPVKAGLCLTPERWPHCSARRHHS